LKLEENAKWEKCGGEKDFSCDKRKEHGHAKKLHAAVATSREDDVHIYN